MNQDPITPIEIDGLLDVHRPDRYDVDDHRWRQPVVDEVARRIPVASARQLAAEKIVAQREGGATRSVNRLLRQVNLDQQLPLDGTIDDLLRRPLSIGPERVCLAAARAQDFEQWAIDERRDAAQEASARFAACDGAEWIAETMRHKGVSLFGDLL